MGALCLAANPKDFSITDPEVLIALGSLLGVLLVAWVIFALVERWRRRAANETLTTHDQLASFRLLYERGELSHDEFERIRGQLLVRLKKETIAAAPVRHADSQSAVQKAKAEAKSPEEGGMEPKANDPGGRTTDE